MRYLLCALLLASSANAADSYKIQVTRKGQDIYKVEGQSIYVKTAYCYEFATWGEVILVLQSQPYSGSINIGKIIFTLDGNTCQVDTILQ